MSPRVTSSFCLNLLSDGVLSLNHNTQVWVPELLN
jgi:hypothetical protein